MVPGMTERERRAAELQRLEWLADATLGPARLPDVTRGDRSREKHSSLRLDYLRRDFALLLRFGQRIRLSRENALRPRLHRAIRPELV
jgi:hypothetical protein